MKVELQKEEEINLDATRGEIGVPMVWYWIRVYKEVGDTHTEFQKCYRKEEDAQKAYSGLLAHLTAGGSLEAKTSVLTSNII